MCMVWSFFPPTFWWITSTSVIYGIFLSHNWQLYLDCLSCWHASNIHVTLIGVVAHQDWIWRAREIVLMIISAMHIWALAGVIDWALVISQSELGLPYKNFWCIFLWMHLICAVHHLSLVWQQCMGCGDDQQTRFKNTALIKTKLLWQTQLSVSSLSLQSQLV